MSENSADPGVERIRRVAASVDDVRVEADGVGVEKTFDVEDFAVPTVVYEVRSDRDDVVDLRLRDPLPEGFPTDRVGFHEEYDRDCWRLADGAVVLERTLAPGETVRTVYGVGLRSPEGVERFMNRPELSVSPVEVTDPGVGDDAEPSAVDDERASAGATDRPEPAGATEHDVDGSVPDPAADAVESSGDDPTWAGTDTDQLDRALSGEAGDRGDASLSAVVDDASSASEGESDDAPDGDPDPDPGLDTASVDVASRFVDQLRDGEVSEADRKRLARELNLRASEATSELLADLRDRVDRERDRLREELEALEGRVDRLFSHAADDDAVAEIERAVDDLETTKADDEAVAHLRSAVDELDGGKADAETVRAVENRLVELSSTAAEAERLEALVDRVERLDRTTADADRADRLVESVEAIESTMARAGTVEELAGDVETLSDRAAGADRLAEVADAVAELDETAARRERVRELDAELRDLADVAAERDRVATLAERVDDLEATVETLAADERVDRVESGMAELERIGAREADLEALERRLDEEYVPAEDVEEELAARVRSGAVDLTAQVVGVSGLLVGALLAATGGTTVAVVGFLVGVLALGGWAYRTRA